MSRGVLPRVGTQGGHGHRLLPNHRGQPDRTFSPYGMRLQLALGEGTPELLNPTRLRERQLGAVGKGLEAKALPPRGREGPRGGHATSLGLSFLTCEVEVITLPSWGVGEFARAAVNKCHRLGGFGDRNKLSRCSGGW